MPRPTQLLGAIVLLSFASLAQGDWVIPSAALRSTTAQVFIEEGQIRLQLEIDDRDLPALAGLLPPQLTAESGPLSVRELQKRFFRSGFMIAADGSAPLSGVFQKSDRRSRSAKLSAAPPATQPQPGSGLVTYLEVAYPLPGRPRRLTIAPPMSAKGRPLVEIGFVLYHQSIPVNDFRDLTGPETLHLDWQEPWSSRFENPNLGRHHRSPVMSFLYVEPGEVRHEIILRAKDLEAWVDLGLKGKPYLEPAQQDAVKRAAAEFLAGKNPVVADGATLTPTIDRVHFIRMSLAGIEVIEPPERLPLAGAFLGVVLRYETPRLPREVTMTWQLFDAGIAEVAAATIDAEASLPYQVGPDDPVVRWRNILDEPQPAPWRVEFRPPPRSPLFSLALFLLCGGLLAVIVLRYLRPAIRGQAPPRAVVALAVLLTAGVGLSVPDLRGSSVSQDEAQAIVTGLLNNIYRAMDHRDESKIYDLLERSAAGDLLAQIYLETRRGLEIEKQGGARVKVNKVEMIEAASENLPRGPGFVSHCTWSVSGSVGHWGHIHQRTNRYEARFTITPVDGAWKITALELLDERRLNTS